MSRNSVPTVCSLLCFHESETCCFVQVQDKVKPLHKKVHSTHPQLPTLDFWYSPYFRQGYRNQTTYLLNCGLTNLHTQNRLVKVKFKIPWQLLFKFQDFSTATF